MLENVVNTGYYLSGIYSLILLVFGTPLNLFCYYIFKKVIPSRTNATIIVLSYLALIELIVPFTWNLNYAIRELILKRRKVVHIKNLEQYSLFICKLISYFAYFSLECSAWLKTLASFTRCITLHHNWPIRTFLLRFNVIHRLCWTVILILGLINLPIWFVNGEYDLRSDKVNNTQIKVKCYQSKFFQFWEIAHLLLYNFIPFILMILFNGLIIKHVQASRRRTKQSKMSSQSMVSSPSNRRLSAHSGNRLSKTLMLIALFFILLTSPSAIFYIFLGKRKVNHRNLITMILSNLATTSHVSSFFIYWLTSIEFQDVVNNIFCCRSLKIKSPISLDDRKPDQLRLASIPISKSDLSQRISLVQVSKSF